MKFLFNWYERVLVWSRHPKAPFYLGAVSFADSSIFPISPVIMIIPMTLANPVKAFRWAWIATFYSILGGVCGVCLGPMGFSALTATPDTIFWLYGPISISLKCVRHLGLLGIILCCVRPYSFQIFHHWGGGFVPKSALIFIVFLRRTWGTIFCYCRPYPFWRAQNGRLVPPLFRQARRLHAQQLIVFGRSFSSANGPRFNLPRPCAHG